MEQSASQSGLLLLLPELFLSGVAILLMMTALFVPKLQRGLGGYVSMIALVVTAALVVAGRQGTVSEELFVNNVSSVFFKMIFISAAFMTAGMLSSVRENTPNGRSSHVNGLLLFSVVGMMFVSMSSGLLPLYISLEVSVIPLVLIAVICGNSEDRLKTARKFLVVNLLANGLILYGMSFLYGLSGSDNLVQMKINIAIIHLTHREIGVIILLAIVSILAGLMIKFALPPFHGWALDVYQKLPLPIAAFVSIGLGTAIFAATVKIFVNGLFAFYGPEQMPNDWGRLVALVSLLVTTGGTILLLRQKEIQKMFIYIYVVQIGFVLSGAVAMNELGLQAAGYSLFAYLFAGMGAYAVVMLVRQATGSSSLDTLRGFVKTSRPLSILLAVFLMSLAGLPLLAGFVARYSVFEADLALAQTGRMDFWMYMLVGGGIILTLVGFVYLAKITLSLFGSNVSSTGRIEVPIPLKLVLGLAVAGVIFFGIFPDDLLRFASGLSESFGFMLE